jgi:hypothetical protein
LFGNYETPAVISKVGKAKLAKGEPLDMTVYGRKEFPRESATQRIGITGLDERHTLDLLNGANAVNEVWWNFINEVETAVAGNKVQTSNNHRSCDAWE